MLRQCGTDDLADRLERDGNHRVLRRLKIPSGPTGLGAGGKTLVGVAIDVETTGLDATSDRIIELAMRRFLFDESGRIVKVDDARSWREDPGEPLSEEIIRLTGLTDADLCGAEIDEAAATRLLNSADLVIAHNAAFDRKFVERRLPFAAGLAWCCSCVEVDWAAAGFDGRALGWLVAQSGWFYDGHRAENDVDAVIGLLFHELPDGRTVLADLLESSRCPSALIEAIGADFQVKDALRARGYRWNPNQKVWWKEVGPADVVAEEFWLARNVYGPGCRARTLGPRMRELTARDRYA
jgi:DNA polymerase-3 subunit epsilon